jgi:uncharacterized membrane protein (DUF485 family)
MTYQKFRDRQKSPAKRFLLILGVVMLIVYFCLGIAIIFWENIPLQMDKAWRIAFAILLIAYAFFRFTRLIKEQQNDEEEN